MPYCTSCGREYPEGNKFCENCGAPVGNRQPAAAPPPPSPPPEISETPEPPAEPAPEPSPPPVPVPAERSESAQPAIPKNTKIIIVALAAIVVIAGILFVALPKTGSAAGFTIPGAGTPVPTTLPATGSQTPSVTPTTAVPTPTPDPYPDALPLREWFTYNEGKYETKATVYRYWINDTYQWHNDMDNHYYPQLPKAGNKYLFVYVVIVNIGTTAYPYPKSNRIYVHYNGTMYTVDPSHYLPDKATNREATPVEILEVEHQSDFFNAERVEDYGYSHGTTSDFITPGQSNAIDGYLIYEVPESLTPEKTYVDIIFDGEDRAAWKLA